MATPPAEPNSTSTVPQQRPGGEADHPARVPTPSHPSPTARGLLTATADGAHPAPPPGGIPGGTRYDFLGELARGGMGIVYKVRDRILGRVVALKTIRGGGELRPDGVARFRREAEAVARLDHPHIIRIHEFGEEDGRPYFTMPLAEGGSLAGRVSAFRADPSAAVLLLEKVAAAVGHAHAHGILHRDLKPSNVLLDAAGEPLVADFGLVKFLDTVSDLTQTGDVLGTPAYMAPEQAAGRTDEVGPWTDVWALGAILYELTTGRLPFLGRNREEILHRILTTAPPTPRTLNPGLTPTLEAVILKCLRREPGERYSTAGGLAEDLAGWRRGDSLTLPGTGRSRRRWLRRITAAGALAALGGAGVLLLPPPNKTAPAKPRPRPQILLVGPAGPVGKVTWPVRTQGTSVGRNRQDGAFFIRTDGFALLELLASPPWPEYRLAAEIRHDEGNRGAVGLTIAHRRYAGPVGDQHCFCRLGFCDREGPGVGFRGCCWAGLLNCWSIGGRTASLPPLRAPVPYRRLALEVTARKVRVFWEGAFWGTADSDKLHHEPRLTDPAPPLPPFFGNVPWGEVRAGGVGVCVSAGTASFRWVVLEPLG